MTKGILEQLTTGQIWTVGIGIFLILVWLVLVVWWLIIMLKNYTLKKDFDNPYKDETLGMPPGTLRGVLTLTILVVVIILVCLSMLVEPIKGGYDEMITAFEIVLAFYFGGRIVNSVSKSDKEKAKHRFDSEEKKTQVEANARMAHLQSQGLAGSPFDVDGAQG